MKTLLTLIFISAAIPCFGADSSGQTGVLSAPGGRYVFGQLSAYARNTFMLDTQTGRVWQVAVDEYTNTVLVPIHYQTISGGVSLVAPDAQIEIEEYKTKLKKAAEQKPADDKKPAEETKK